MVNVPQRNQYGMFELIGGGIIALIAIVIILSAFVSVPAGSIGVKLQWGGSTNQTIPQGLNFIVSIEQSVVLMNTQTQAYQVLATSASKDLQNTNTTVTLNFHINSNQAAQIYNKYGVNYAQNIIFPTIQGTVKQVTAKFNATELIDDRAEVQQEIQDNLTEKLSPYGIIVEQAPITNFQFSSLFENAIETKVAQQQNLQTQLINLSITRVKANQTIAAAFGNATAVAVRAAGTANAIDITAAANATAIAEIDQALSSNPQYVNWLIASRWNGIVPTTEITGGNGATPLLNIQTAKNGSG